MFFLLLACSFGDKSSELADDVVSSHKGFTAGSDTDTFYVSSYKCIRRNNSVEIQLYPLYGDGLTEDMLFTKSGNRTFRLQSQNVDTIIICNEFSIDSDGGGSTVFVRGKAEYEVRDKSLYVHVNNCSYEFANRTWKMNEVDPDFIKIEVKHIKMLNSPSVFGANFNYKYKVIEIAGNKENDLSFLIGSWIFIPGEGFPSDLDTIEISKTHLEYVPKIKITGAVYDYEGYQINIGD